MSRSVVSREIWVGRARALTSLRAAVAVALLLALLVAAEPARSAPTTFTVNSTGDENDLDYPDGTFDGSSDGTCDVNAGTTGDQCTLRAAIQEANATTDVDTMNFQIPGTDPNCNVTTGVCTISPASLLPAITEQATINGYTQSGADANDIPLARDGTDADLRIELNGAQVVPSGNGLAINASDVEVKGLVINRFSTGISISGAGSGATIEGNFIGPDPSGTLLVNATGTGVSVFGDGANIIGGASPAARNLISGNFRGIVISSNGGNTIQGNLIGTKANGIEALGNTLQGVQIGSSNNIVGAGDGVDDANANIIAFNGTDGVFVAASGAGNRILSNSIHTNGELGIDLMGGTDSTPGVTKNDLKDRDTGANHLQNFPVLSSATSSGNQTTITGKLKSTPRKSFTIQFFTSPEKDPSGFGEGKEFLDNRTVKTSREGSRSFSVTFTLSRDLQGERVTATATRLVPDPSDPTTLLLTDTSEFSAAMKVK